MNELLKYIWLLIPAGIGNMTPILTALVWPKWSSPVDGGKSINGIRILGDHKTWRGLITGIIAAELAYLIEIRLIGQVVVSPWWFGGLLGLGALGGDMVKSFFKRRFRVKSGVSWFPWDQIDWIVGLVIVTMGWRILDLKDMMILLGIGLVLHLMTKLLGYLLRINKTAI